MGVLQRFERRLEGMVEGAFARAFKSEVEPVEIASAVQREMDDRAAIVAQGRTLVPNDFVVELSDIDHSDWRSTRTAWGSSWPPWPGSMPRSRGTRSSARCGCVSRACPT